MNLHEVLELIQLRRFERDPVKRMLNRTHMPDDFRAVAKRKLPRAVFDYVDGAADEEIAVEANRQAFMRRKLSPQLLRDVSVTDLTGGFLGHHVQVPIGLAPTGYTRGDVELWLAPSDDGAYVYLVNARNRSDVERWVNGGGGCA